MIAIDGAQGEHELLPAWFECDLEVAPGSDDVRVTVPAMARSEAAGGRYAGPTGAPGFL